MGSDRPVCHQVVLTELTSAPRLPANVAALFRSLPLLDVEEGYWSRAGQLRGRLLAKGHKARLADTLIAQSCIDHEVGLITVDRDFRLFEKHESAAVAVTAPSTCPPSTPTSSAASSVPPALLAARAQVERGELTAAAFKQIEDRAVDEAVALQQDAGLDVITDGELRRYAFFGHLVDALEGFEKHSGWSITFRDDAGHKAQLQRPVVVDKLRWKRQMAVEEFTYLRGRTTRPVKVTLVSAQQAAAYYDPDKSRGAYATRDAYLADLVDFTRREIAEAIAAVAHGPVSVPPDGHEGCRGRRPGSPPRRFRPRWSPCHRCPAWCRSAP